MLLIDKKFNFFSLILPSSPLILTYLTILFIIFIYETILLLVYLAFEEEQQEFLVSCILTFKFIRNESYLLFFPNNYDQ